jgi:PAS domain S-box-containing protein
MKAVKKKPRKAGSATPANADAGDTQAMLHDLDVHRLELEMQNRELREAQGQLEESRSRLADLYDFAPVAYVTLDPMSKVLEANLTAAAMFGIERGNLIGKFLTTLVAAPDRRALRDHIRRCFGQRTRVETDVSFAVGGRPTVTAQVVSAPFIAADGAVIGCKTTLTDITALKQGQDQLQLLAHAAGKLVSSFDYRATLAEVARLAVPILADICIVDLLNADGRIERLEVACASDAVAARLAPFRSASARSTEGSASAWVMRMRQPILLGESSPAVVAGFEHDALIRASEGQSMMVVPLAARDSVLGVMTFIATESGRRFTDTALATARDLAVHAATAIENARLYESARRAIRARQDVLTFVSHDLRNPLTGIHLTTEMLLRGAHGNERRKGWSQLERVRRSTQQMQRMIDDLLDVASIEAGRLAIDLGSHDVQSICEDTLVMLAPAAADRGVSVRHEVRSGGLVARCDRERVVQVLSNLLSNAVKFTPKGGTVTLTVDQTGDRAVFTVLDTGPGVPAALREHVFERFWQAEETARKGRGLGLYIAKGLVEAQGGSIWMESPAQGGARFSFTLPLAPADDVERAKRAAPAAKPAHGGGGPRRRPRPAARPG